MPNSQNKCLMQLVKLEQNYHGKFKLGPINLNLNNGTNYFILGRNGAGKSTLFQMMTGNSDSFSGHVLLNNLQLSPKTPALKKTIGYLPQEMSLPQWSNGLDLLNYAISLYDADKKHDNEFIKNKIEQILTKWDTLGFAQQAISSLSHGMQKRIALCLATFHDPEFLILDEPFTGLDLFHIRTLKQEIVARKKRHKTTIISTHIAPYVAELADEVFVISAGKLDIKPFTDTVWHKTSTQEKVSLIDNYFFSEKN